MRNQMKKLSVRIEAPSAEKTCDNPGLIGKRN